MAIDDILWTIQQKVYRKIGNTMETETVMGPLYWYIETGRAPLEFERRLKACTSRQLTTIANRLIQHRNGDYQCAINSVCQYIKFDRCV